VFIEIEEKKQRLLESKERLHQQICNVKNGPGCRDEKGSTAGALHFELERVNKSLREIDDFMKNSKFSFVAKVGGIGPEEIDLIFCKQLPPIENNNNLYRFISEEAPIAKALQGKSPGETVTVDAPVGKLNITIIDLYEL